jgi:hypothetical protein
MRMQGPNDFFTKQIFETDIDANPLISDGDRLLNCCTPLKISERHLHEIYKPAKPKRNKFSKWDKVVFVVAGCESVWRALFINRNEAVAIAIGVAQG